MISVVNVTYSGSRSPTALAVIRLIRGRHWTHVSEVLGRIFLVLNLEYIRCFLWNTMSGKAPHKHFGTTLHACAETQISTSLYLTSPYVSIFGVRVTAPRPASDGAYLTINSWFRSNLSRPNEHALSRPCHYIVGTHMYLWYMRHIPRRCCILRADYALG